MASNPIGSASPPVTSPRAAPSEAVPDQKRALLLKKVLDAQKDQAAELMKQLQGKGQIIDIRV